MKYCYYKNRVKQNSKVKKDKSKRCGKCSEQYGGYFSGYPICASRFSDSSSVCGRSRVWAYDRIEVPDAGYTNSARASKRTACNGKT